MMKVTSEEKYNTSFGQCFVLNGIGDIRVGDKIIIDNTEQEVKRIILPTTPNSERVAVFV